MSALNILNFINSLRPRMARDDVLEDLNSTDQELLHAVLPSLEQASGFFKSYKPVSEGFKTLVQTFYRNVGNGSRQRGSLIEDLEDRMKEVKKNLQFVIKSQEELLEKDIISEGLTAKKAVLLQAGENLSFVTRYTLDLLTYLYQEEAKDLSEGQVAETDMPPNKVKLVMGSMPNYARLLGKYSMPHAKFVEALDKMPDVAINNATAAALAAVYQEDKLNPFSTSFVQNFDGNPIYRLRLMVAEWQANRYKVAKDKKKMLELRLLNLKLLQEKNPSPQLENEISYIQNRIEGLEAKMHRMEESVQ